MNILRYKPFLACPDLLEYHRVQVCGKTHVSFMQITPPQEIVLTLACYKTNGERKTQVTPVGHYKYRSGLYTC